MKRLNNTSLYNNIVLILIGMILLDLSRRYYFIIILLSLYLIFIRKNKFRRYIYLSLSIFFIVVLFVKYESSINENETLIEAEVVEVCNSYSILRSNEKFIIYDTSYKPGDILKLKGEYKRIDSNDIPYVFNFEEYLNNKGIYYQFKFKEIKIIDQRFNLNIFNYKLSKFIEANYDRSDYYKALIISENDISNEGINNLGIAHMLCISGLHINLILEFFKKMFKLKEKHMVIPLFFYLVIIGFSVSVLRVFLTLLIRLIFKDRISSIDSISLSCIILLFINPNYIFEVGFILTYLVSFSFLLTKKYKLIVANLISLPFSISFNDKINVLTVLYNFIFSIVFKYILIPLTFICFFIKPLDFIYSYFISSFEFMVDILDNKYLLLNMASFNSIEYLIYYLTLFLFLMRDKLYYFIYMVFHLFKGIIILGNNMIVFDVGQGDSTLIYTDSEVVMIDCFSDSYKFVKKRGIREIDYLFLTHSHNDHIGALDELLETVTVKNIVISYYDDIDVENAIKVKSGDVINVGDISFNVLGPIDDDSNINNASIVLQFDFLNKRFLYTGDIEYEAELDLIKRYGKSLKSDVLKVAHHGSNTSSNKEFIRLVDPSYSIISVGQNNYGHPSKETLDTLSSSIIYQTRINGSIFITGFNSFHIIDI